ncbi:MAG: YkgJ family cysteine cluster protein [Candidatus Algichlamydia australiensis]|nr:YkgJ family cysteine cluster protein [Chlamydiales bacterium]
MSKPWYSGGLRFKCTECGGCCTGSPGYVWLEEKDIEALISYLKISRSAFLRRYTRQVGKRISLLEDSTTFDCVFLKENRCTVYAARPKQCRTFPFWPSLLRSKKDWESARSYCEGIDHPDGEIFTIN